MSEPFGGKPHDALVLRAERWLRNQGCQVVIRDPFRTVNQEQPDAIGWRSGVSIVIECKVSRSDFFADAKKSFRARSGEGMGHWRFYLCPPEVIEVEDLPGGWGLLYAAEKTIRKVHGVPPNTGWYTRAPFMPNLRAESIVMQSALRRMQLRGHLQEIYEPIHKGPAVIDRDNWAL
ncbi:MAG: hypothetical protein AAGI11_15190 [Pseudomonadota bacterium]